MRTTAVNIASLLVLVLEGQREPRAELHHLAVLDLDVELLDLCDAQVAQRARRSADRVARRVLPRIGAGADHLGDPINSFARLFRHDASSVGLPFCKSILYARLRDGDAAANSAVPAHALRLPQEVLF